MANKRRRYTDAQKENAVGLAHDTGLAKASQQLDIPKSTIKTWADKLGVNVADEAMIEKTEKATVVSVATRRQKVAETKERLVVLLAAIAELGAHQQIAFLKSGDLSLAEAVGATTRAIHDLQLLEGKPTEIQDDISADDIKRMRDEIQTMIEGP